MLSYSISSTSSMRRLLECCIGLDGDLIASDLRVSPPKSSVYQIFETSTAPHYSSLSVRIAAKHGLACSRSFLLKLMVEKKLLLSSVSCVDDLPLERGR